MRNERLEQIFADHKIMLFLNPFLYHCTQNLHFLSTMLMSFETSTFLLSSDLGRCIWSPTNCVGEVKSPKLPTLQHTARARPLTPSAGDPVV